MTISRGAFRLYGSSLCSKWGFYDGDIFFDFIEDYYPNEGVNEHDVLDYLIKNCLLPVLNIKGIQYEYVFITTIHNPCRIRTLNNQKVNWYDVEIEYDLPYVDIEEYQLHSVIKDFFVGDDPLGRG